MSKTQTETALPVAPHEVADTGRIRVGAGFRLPPAKLAAEVADAGRIRVGAGFRLLAPRAR
jgi:hypothetical protein